MELPKWNDGTGLHKKRPFVRLVAYPDQVSDEEKDYVRKFKMNIVDSNTYAIGSILLSVVLTKKVKGKRRERYATIRDIKLKNEHDNNYLGKHYGKAAYLRLLEFLGDIPLHSGERNKYSTRVWDSLVRDGLAEPVYFKYGGIPIIGYYTSLPGAVKTKLLFGNCKRINTPNT